MDEHTPRVNHGKRFSLPGALLRVPAAGLKAVAEAGVKSLGETRQASWRAPQLAAATVAAAAAVGPRFGVPMGGLVAALAAAPVQAAVQQLRTAAVAPPEAALPAAGRQRGTERVTTVPEMVLPQRKSW